MSDIAAEKYCRRSGETDGGSSGRRRKAPRRDSDPILADYRRDKHIRQISPALMAGAIRALDFCLIGGLGAAIFFFYVAGQEPGLYSFYISTSLAVAGLAVVLFEVSRLYLVSTVFSMPSHLARMFFAWTIAFGLFLACLFFLKLGADYSRVWLVSWFVAGGVCLMVFRFGLTMFVHRWSHSGLLDRRAVIVGGGEAAEELIRALEGSSNTDIRICGVFDDRQDDRASDQICGYPVLGNFDELIAFGRETRVDLLIVTIPLTAQGRIKEVLKKLWVLPVDICLSAHTNSLRFRPRTYSYIGNVPFIDVQDKAFADWDWVAKLLFDKFVAIAALVALAPVMALIALAVRLDSRGPIFFKQRRHGFNNELVEVFKFRSMYAEQTDFKAAKLVTKDDPRVTRVGRFIRKTSLDELPQFFNVLRGDLSVVGPRPHATEARAAEQLYSEVVDGYFARHRVKPGITGWAQINGWRGETDTEEKIKRRVEHDLYYIENWSVLFDLYIVLVTPYKLVGDENAY